MVRAVMPNAVMLSVVAPIFFTVLAVGGGGCHD